MRFHRGFVAVVLLLTACSWGKTPGTLPPEEVLQNAARASQTLDSGNYVLDGRYTISGTTDQSSAGDIHMEGTVSHGGEQFQLVLSVNGELTDSTQKSDITGSLEVIVAGKDAVYMKLHSLNVQPSSSLFRPDLIGQFAGKWWQLPAGTEMVGQVQVSPDPGMLQAQSQVVQVEKDNGLVQLNGRQVYHYTVVLDKEKLLAYLQKLAQDRGETFDLVTSRAQIEQLAGQGELWIDAETFNLQRVTWDIASIPMATIGSLNLSFTVDFRNHNSAAPIVLPTDAQPLAPAALFDVPAMEFPEQALPGVPSDLEQQMIDELLQNMQSQ